MELFAKIVNNFQPFSAFSKVVVFLLERGTLCRCFGENDMYFLPEQKLFWGNYCYSWHLLSMTSDVLLCCLQIFLDILQICVEFKYTLTRMSEREEET